MIGDSKVPGSTKPYLFKERECFVSDILLLYVRKLEALGLKRPLQTEDLFPIPESYRSSKILEEYRKYQAKIFL